MIPQLILTAFLFGILLYALTEYRRSPAVGLIAILAAVGGLYFVWVPSHATRLAEFVGIGRGVDLRAHRAHHRTGDGTRHRERTHAPIDDMSQAAPTETGRSG